MQTYKCALLKSIQFQTDVWKYSLSQSNNRSEHPPEDMKVEWVYVARQEEEL